MSGALFVIKNSYLKSKLVKNGPLLPIEQHRFSKTWTTVSLSQINDVNIGSLLNIVAFKQTKII